MARVRLDDDKQDRPTIEEMKRALRIDRHSLDDEVIAQPEQFHWVSEMHVLLISQRDKAKSDLREAEAKADRAAREDLENAVAREEIKKITEAMVTAIVMDDDDVLWAKAELREKEKAVGEWAAMKEAWDMRKYALKDLVTLWVAGYFGNSSETRQGSRERVRDRELEPLRAERKRRAEEE